MVPAIVVVVFFAAHAAASTPPSLTPSSSPSPSPWPSPSPSHLPSPSQSPSPSLSPTSEPTPAPTEANQYFYDPGVGTWGGICTCPDGQQYEVGDNNDMCGSLACEGGFSGSCSNGGISSSSAHMKVVCAQAVSNKYQHDAGVGAWGGICTCPDGQQYEVGDNHDSCGSLACVEGTPGSCSAGGIDTSNAGMKVICAQVPTPEPTPEPTSMPTPSPTRMRPTVVVHTTLQGVDYDLLFGDHEAYALFETSTKVTLADLGGPSITSDQVSIIVTQGSVIVTAEISVPDNGAEADQIAVAEHIWQLVQTANVSEKIVESIALAASNSTALQEAVQSDQLQATSQVMVITAPPSAMPTRAPTEAPTPEPTADPTPAPTEAPTPEPSAEPTLAPTESPTPEPTPEPTSQVRVVAAAPTAGPTLETTTGLDLGHEANESTTAAPSAAPTSSPTVAPTAAASSSTVAHHASTAPAVPFEDDGAACAGLSSTAAAFVLTLAAASALA